MLDPGIAVASYLRERTSVGDVIAAIVVVSLFVVLSFVRPVCTSPLYDIAKASVASNGRVLEN